MGSSVTKAAPVVEAAPVQRRVAERRELRCQGEAAPVRRLVGSSAAKARPRLCVA